MSSPEVCERRSSLTTGGGPEDILLIMRFIYSGLSWVALVESFDCLFHIVEVCCWILDLVVFG